MDVLRKFPVRCALAAFSGLVYAQAFPPLDWGWMVLPGFCGLLLALDGQSGRPAVMLGLLHGVCAYGAGLTWVLNLFGPVALILWCVLAVFTVLFAAIHGAAQLRGMGGLRLALCTAISWGALEFIRAEIFPLKFPWMSAGLAVGPNLLLPWIGVYGVGTIVIFAAAALTGRMWKSASASLAVLFAAVLLSSPHHSPVSDEENAVSMGGLQFENVTIAAFVEATEKLPAGIDHVVWPEYAVPFDVRKNKREWEGLLDLCREKCITLTLGTQSRPGGGAEWRNIALTMDASGALGEHNKNHTVHFFDDGIAGETALPITTPHGKVGTPICFDGDYEGVIRRMTAAGAEYIVVPTMDAEPWGKIQHDQHAELTRIRAAENGRWIFVTATSGISQLIDPSGHLHARLGAMEQGGITGTLKRETKLTFYTRYGWLFPWIVLTAAAALWLRMLFKPPPFHPDKSATVTAGGLRFTAPKQP
ncbi:hypothetical protein HZ994_11175 [Akkermansiaceae bacterium]|nr:hypothetical protein HZ994_11175 [Akkermansiaceae bacterium]